MKLEALAFRPARPGLREVAPVVVMGLLVCVLATRLSEQPGPGFVFGFVCSVGLVACGAWLTFHLRWPGRPVLRIGADGLSAERGGRTRVLRWEEVAEVQVLHQLTEMRFVPVDGGRPILVHRDMITRDGRRLDAVIDPYLRRGRVRRDKGGV